MHQIAAKAQAFIEAKRDEFKIYSRRVVDNAIEMCEVFQARGLDVQTNGTDSHIILLDLTSTGRSGREAADLLEENSITVNKNGIPNDPKSFVETSGIRIGTAAMTTRGYNRKAFNTLANKIVDVINGE